MRLAVFLGFVCLGLAVARARGLAAGARRPVTLLVFYVVFVSTAVGVIQRESWPFTNWAIFHHLTPGLVPGLIELELVDARGHPFRVDARAWEPIASEDLESWLNRYFRQLNGGQRDRLAAFLLTRAEAARIQFLASGTAGVNGRILGSLAAPYHFRRPAVWRSPDMVPATAFVGLRLWEVDWDVEAGRPEARRLLFEFHAGPGS